MILRTIRLTIITVATILLVFNFTGCGNEQKAEPLINDNNDTDQMWKDSHPGEELYMFKIDGKVYIINNIYEVNYYFDDSLTDGGFYKVTADITYLNGGIAGYVDYPEIENVLNVEEISPFDLHLPSITEESYGLTVIGDYADGDFFLNEYNTVAVWKDGDWVWRYDATNPIRNDDGSRVYMAVGISKEEALQGIAGGILSGKDYFVVPPTK